ncbi:MAG: hypothetical protein IJJ78_06225 [Paludibacteraceae bacterium]|nr:hypothetical protein [Paludibacteraceae bacterium]
MSTIIANLRKDGQLNEAYRLADERLRLAPTDLWAKRDMAWVLYDLAKKHATIDTKEQFLKCLSKCRKLQMPETDDVFHKSVVALIKSMAYDVARSGKEDETFFDALFVHLQGFSLARKTELCSFVMLAFMRAKWWRGFGGFFEWWGLDSFSEADFKPYEVSNNVRIQPLAERAVMAYCKWLIDNGTDAQIMAFIPRLQQFSEQHKNFLFLPYYCAKLMLKIDRKDDVLRYMRLFAKKKGFEFWVWDVVGDTFDDASLRLKFYAKALICRAKPEMTVKVREKTALLLFELGYSAQSLAEMLNVVAIRERNKWKTSPQLTQKITQLRADGVEPGNDITAFYTQLSHEAESMLGATRETQPKAKFKGVIIVHAEGYGFVKCDGKTIFVSPALLNGARISNRDAVAGEYRKSFDKKRNHESYAAVSINKK